MKTKIKKATAKFFLFILINLTRLTIIWWGFVLETIIRVCEVVLNFIQVVCERVDVWIKLEFTEKQENVKKFDDDEIAEMANSLPEKVETIKEIENYLEVSFRQARKVKWYIDNKVNIRRNGGNTPL